MSVPCAIAQRFASKLGNAAPRRGRLQIARLIAEHGRDDHCDLLALIAHDCPRLKNPHVSMYERCGVHFPELPRRFLTGQA